MSYASKYIFVGKRSSLLNQTLLPLLKKRFGSLEIYSLDYILANYNQIDYSSSIIIIFSLPSSSNQNQYFQFLSCIKCLKLIHISSSCIYAKSDSLSILPSSYHALKTRAHSLVSSNECGVNVVVGIPDQSFPSDCFPYTSPSLLADQIYSLTLSSQNPSRDIFVFRILSNSPISSLSFIFNLIRSIPYRFRLSRLSLLIDLIYKFINFKSRYYTFLSNQSFTNCARIGDGAFGAAASSPSDLIFCDHSPNRKLPSFTLNTLCGHTPLGLDSLRHGVCISHNPFTNLHQKVWNLSLRVRRPLRSLIPSPVISLCWDDLSGCFVLKTRTHTYFANKIKLAAGCLQNIRLLLQLASPNFSPSTISCSDHFISDLGFLSFSDCINSSFLHKYSLPFLVFRGNVKLIDNDDLSSVLEVRLSSNPSIPRCFSFIRYFHSLSSFIFNRIGVGIRLPYSKLSIFAQVLSDKCYSIFVSDLHELHGLSLVPAFNLNDFRTSAHSRLTDHLSSSYSSFLPVEPRFAPSHHLHANSSLLHDPVISNHISAGRLIVCGSPSFQPLGPFHHTLRIAKDLKYSVRV